MRGDQQGGPRHADCHPDEGPGQVQPDRDADDAGGETEYLAAAGEPDRRLVEQASVAFGLRNVVDGVMFGLVENAGHGR